MQYRPFGKTGEKVSVLGYGCLRLPSLDIPFGGERIDEAEAIRLIRYAIDQGVNYVDTAFMYHGGNSEGLAPRMLNTSIKNDASSVIGNGNSLAPLRSSGYGESSFRHHQPLSFGIAVRKEFAHGLSLESGVNYTLLRSDVRMQYTSDDVAQKLHFIGVPLRFNWQFLERGRFSLYMGAGGMVEKCVSARLGSETVDEPGVQWSALAAVGAQYRVGGMVGLYFEPEGSYYFTETGLRTSRTDSPLTLTLRLGVRLSF